MSKPTYGFSFNRGDNETLPAVTTDMSSVFIVGCSDDADANIVPLGVTVAFNSNDQTYLRAMGTGDLRTALDLINAQLGPLQVAARVALHRTKKGSTDSETINRILGDAALGTGIYAALGVGARFGFTPRLMLVAGGYTGRDLTYARDTVFVSTATVAAGNTGGGGITMAPSVPTGVNAKTGRYIVRCKDTASKGIFTVVDPAGNVIGEAATGVLFSSSHVRFTIEDGTPNYQIGDGFVITVRIIEGLLNANPLVVALPQIENALLAHAIIDGPNGKVSDALAFRGTIASDHTVMVDFAVTPASKAAGVFVAGAACVVGIAIAVDFGNDGIPSQSWANQPIQGITALKRYDTFSLNDGSTEGQQLLAAGVGVAERGNAGDPGAVSDAGFILICFSTCSLDPQWQFLNVTRMRDYIHLIAQRKWRIRIGRNNITLHAVQAVENDLVYELGQLKSNEHIIDFRVGIDRTKNTPATIRAGGLRVFFKAEEASPLLLIEADSYRYPEALTSLVTAISGETDQLVGLSA